MSKRVQKQVPKVLDRAFVTDEGAVIKIKSDSRGDECVIFKTRLSDVIAIDVMGMMEKEPVLFIHYAGGATSNITYDSRTCVQNAFMQLTKLLSAVHKSTPPLSSSVKNA